MISTPLKISDISIIIPTLNEGANIASLANHFANGDCEMILVDGGSTDSTVAEAKKHKLNVITCQSGRARQLNFGAAQAKGKVLLFLHADTRLPHGYEKAILRTIKHGSHIAGAFSLAIKNPTVPMRFIAACANLRSRLWQMPYGDQAIFIEKEYFSILGGFPDLPIMEDYFFIKEAQKLGKIALLPEKVTTSARRWRRLGVFRTTIINQMIILGFHLKISPERLALFYRR